MKKGIFWCRNHRLDDPELIVITAECDQNGNTLQSGVTFSSKSGDNFNHRTEWKKMDRKTTAGKPFDHWPRGRVEIRNGKATVYLNPELNREEIVEKVMQVFELQNSETIRSVRIISDGSSHYKYRV